MVHGRVVGWLMAQKGKPGTHRRGLMTIAAYKFVKASALLALGFGELHYLHRNLAQEIAHLVDLLRVDPHNHYLMWLMERVSKVDEHRLRQLSVGTFFYAVLFLCEGTGLALGRRWAEYLTIVSTASLLPIEVYEIFARPSSGKGIVLLANLAIVVYLVWVVRSEGGKHAAVNVRGQA
jgi:uncharacterized membrane protein (DUF2068 family)